jgi:uncharacterized membrane protein YdjX (TVP38/TMEM64 family)
MNPPSRRLLMTGVVLVSVVFLGGIARERLGIQLDVESVRAFAEGLGPAGPLLFVFVVAGRSLLWLPSQIVLIAAGLCFGTVVGSLVGGAGLMISGLFLFGLARYAGRASIERRMGRRIRHLLDLANHRSGAVAFGLACGYPVSPLSPLQAAAGLTPMPIANFVASAFVGGALRASLFAFFGDALAKASFASLAWPTVAFLAAAGSPFVFPAGRRWLREIFVAPPVAPSPPGD